MSIYFIHEDNFEKFEKRIQAIQKKCNKNNTYFHYEVIDNSVFVKVKDEQTGEVSVRKFVKVDVEGKLHHENWVFAATIEHLSAGNVIRAFETELTIPERYNSCGPECEHCKKVRSRKDTYLVYNIETQEFKQVGKSCMAEYTNGLDAEDAARYISLFDEAISGGYCSGPARCRYTSTDEVLAFAFETVKNFGYVSTDNSSDLTPSTKIRVREFMQCYRYVRTDERPAAWKQQIEDMESVNFNPESEEIANMIIDAKNWIASEDTTGNSYLRNLQLLCNEEYTEARDFGILCSLPVAYQRHLGHVAERKRKEDEAQREQSSEYQGSVGSKLTVALESITCVSSWASMYGMTYLYKIIDTLGNVYIWYASKPLDSEVEYTSVSGSVKGHEEYNGVKQTILTRCKAN